MPRKKQKGKVATAAAARNSSPQRRNKNSAANAESVGLRSPKKTMATVASTTKGFTLDRINDILDFETEHIMMNRENRQEHLDTFEYFWDLHPAKLVKSGRRYARFLIAQILVIASGQKPYISMVRAKNRNHQEDDDDDDDDDDGFDDDDNNDDTDNEEGDDENENILCLDQWSREHWDKLQYLLLQLRQVLLRDDVTINYSSKNDTLGFPGISAAAASRKPTTNPVDMDSSSDEANHTVDEVDHGKLVALAPGLGKKFRMLLQFIEINKAIAPIREELERQIREPIKISDSDIDDDNNNNNDVVVVKTKELIEVFEYADKIKDEMVKGAVLRIFHPSAQEDAEDSKTPSLQTRKQLIKILQTAHNAYNLVDFQDRLDRILLKFAKQVFGDDDVPILVKLGYTVPTEEHVVDVDDDDEDDFILAAANGHGSKKKKTALPPSSSVRGRSRDSNNKNNSGNKLRPLHSRQRRIPKELKELKRGRDALNNNHGDDPRDESLRIMEQAKRAAALRNKRRNSSRGSGRQEDEDDDENNSPQDDADDDNDDDSGLQQQQQKSPSRSATKKRQGTKRKQREHILDRSSSDESDALEDDDDDDSELEKEYAAIAISEVPKKKARVVAETQSKNYGLPRPDPGIFDENGNVMKRTRWSDDEKTAIKQGVTKHGVGKWVEIKQEYGRVLHNRTTVQIKDKWRNMVKNKEVE